MASNEDVMLDLEELKQFQSIAKRPCVVSLISSEIHNLEKDLSPSRRINPSETTTYSNVKALSIYEDDAFVPPSVRIEEISDNLKSVFSSTVKMPEDYKSQVPTPVVEIDSPGSTFSNYGSDLKHSLVKECLKFLNSANKEQLKTLRGIGEKRVTYILELRENSTEPFKSLDDLQEIGLSAKQIKSMMRGMAAEIFT